MTTDNPGATEHPLISIVYVNYNTNALLLESLRSVRDNLGISHEVIVVDNASLRTPLDEQEVLAVDPDARVVYSEDNRGFGGGNNLGVQYARGKYLWILNTDTIVPPDHGMSKLVEWLERHPEYGAALPELLNTDGTHQDLQTGRFPTLTRIVGDKLRVPGSLFYTDPLMSQDVEFASCAALMVRATAFERVGGFSKDFFFFFEDTDLCKKLHAAGYKIRLVYEARIVHIRGGSIANMGARKRIYYDALDVYARKWLSPVSYRGIAVLSQAMRLWWKSPAAQKGNL